MIACADRRAEPSGDGRTLPGFRKKSFILNYAGGEIWFEHLDGIYGFTELAAKNCAPTALHSADRHLRHTFLLFWMRRLSTMNLSL